MGRRELIDVEKTLIAQHSTLAELHQEAVRSATETIRALIARHDTDADTDAFAARVAAAQQAALTEYAERVRGLLPVDDVARWVRIRDALKLSAYDAPLGTVDAPGAASLLDALEAVPADGEAQRGGVSLDRMLAEIADRCTCGYARTRTLPKQTCLLCAEALSTAWTAEERRVLTRLPELRRELDLLFDALVDRLAQLRADPDGDSWSVVEHEQRQAARRLTRLNKAARNEIFEGMLASWQELAAAASHDPRPIPRSTAKRWKRTGLGTARLSAVVRHGNDEVKARMKAKGAGR